MLGADKTVTITHFGYDSGTDTDIETTRTLREGAVGTERTKRLPVQPVCILCACINATSRRKLFPAPLWRSLPVQDHLRRYHSHGARLA